MLWECHIPGHMRHYSFQYNMYHRFAFVFLGSSTMSVLNVTTEIIYEFFFFFEGGRKNIHSVAGLISRTVLLMLAPKETILVL